MHDLPELSDNELVSRSLLNKDDFVYLMKRYEQKLLYYIMRLSGLKIEDAEDVLQEVFVKTYYNLNGFKTGLKFSSWIYRIAHNECMSEMRKRNARPLYYYTEDDLVRIADSISVSPIILKQDTKDYIKKILSKMDKKYGEVLVLKFLEEKDYNEISDILKKPIGTIGTLINRAKKQFKKEFDKQYK